MNPLNQIDQTQNQIKQSLEGKGFDFSGILGLLLQSIVPIMLDKLSTGCGANQETPDERAARIAGFVTTPAGKAQLIREVRKQSNGLLTNIDCVHVANAIADQLQQKSVVVTLIGEANSADTWALV